MLIPQEFPAFSPEFEKIKSELLAARENYAVLLEKYTCMTGVESKNLMADYMFKIGKKEYELFSCNIQIMRLKREISLLQTARNRGEHISIQEINAIIENEFAEYQKQLKFQKEKLEYAEKYLGARQLSAAECAEIKQLYRNIVRKLHPDLNDDLPPVAAELWNRVQEAYNLNDWDELVLLGDMVNELQTDRKSTVDSLNSTEALKKNLEKIQQKTSDLEKLIKSTLEHVPFTYRELLQNPDEVRRKRKELDEQISSSKKYIEDLKNIRNGYGA